MEKEGVSAETEKNEKECEEMKETQSFDKVQVAHEQQVGERKYEYEDRREFNVSKLQTLNQTNPLRIAIQGSHRSIPNPSPPPPLNVNTTPQQSSITLNSRSYTNRISLFIFLLHTVAAIGLVCFLGFKVVQGMLREGYVQRQEKRVLRYWFPQVECSTVIGIALAFIWQKAIREWPAFMIKFILWASFATSLTAGILLLCFQKPSTDGVGVALVGFSIGNGLYSCWVTRRIKFTAKVITKSLEPIAKFPDINVPIYWMLGVGFLWISFWVLAVIGALNFYFPPLVIILLVLSLAWTTEVLRNVANLTVSRVIALYYLRGMQSSTQFCFQRAMSRNLGSACLGSLFVPAIEALRIVARGLNLLEGEDEFMFSCAHCCLNVMESIFKNGNGWAYVQIATYGKGFVRASQDTWALFERQGMERIVDADITSAICFLTGVCSGSICVIATASWTYAVHKSFIATVSLLAFFIGYLMTRIGMAVPHACVSCYYVCYAENPDNRLFDKTIPDRINFINSGCDVLVRTPRVRLTV